MCHDAAVLATTMCGLYVHAYIFGICGPHDLSGDVVAEFFL
jgi:hypothetical protein